MTVEHAHSVDNGVYQHAAPNGMPPSGGGPAPLVEFLDEERGGYKVAEPDHGSVAYPTTLGGKFSHMVVLHDLKDPEVWRATVFEGVASLVNTFVGILLTISTLESQFSHPVVAIAVFQGLMLAICILAAAPATGGHVNPCITWTEMLTGHVTAVRGALYVVAQIVGAVVASIAAKAVVGDALAKKYSLAGCYLTSHAVPPATGMLPGLDPGQAFLLETALVFFVLFVAYSVALDPPRLPRTGYTLAPFMIGGVVGLGIFAAGSIAPGYGGAGINPARCLGPAVALGDPLWTHQWVFWVGSAVAGLLMAALYRTIPPTHVQVYKLRHAARAKSRSHLRSRRNADVKPTTASSVDAV